VLLGTLRKGDKKVEGLPSAALLREPDTALDIALEETGQLARDTALIFRTAEPSPTLLGLWSTWKDSPACPLFLIGPKPHSAPGNFFTTWIQETHRSTQPWEGVLGSHSSGWLSRSTQPPLLAFPLLPLAIQQSLPPATPLSWGGGPPPPPRRRGPPPPPPPPPTTPPGLTRILWHAQGGRSGECTHPHTPPAGHSTIINDRRPSPTTSFHQTLF
jgi:hypothetical protein